MALYRITGGASLSGEVIIGGAKNGASKLIIASLLTNDSCEITNVPQNGEISIACELVRATGAQVQQMGNTVTVNASSLGTSLVSELSRKNRLPILAIGPLLHRTGRAHVPRLGGDKIGARPVNFHIDALRAFGAQIEETAEAFVASATALHGATIELPYPSVGATETTLLTAVLAHGTTIIRNAAIEPEIQDLVTFLNAMGAQVRWHGERTLEILGVTELHGTQHRVIPDRLEAASYAAAAVATGGEVTLRNVVPEHIELFLITLQNMGTHIDRLDDNSIRVRYHQPLIGTTIRTDVYPGFATDWQQPMAVVLTQADGQSIIHETVYEDRFGYTNELNQMGASIAVDTTCGEFPCRFNGHEAGHMATIAGPTPLRAADITIPDIRAGMAHVIAALTAQGVSRLQQVEILDRGYEQLEQKLRALGANIERVEA